MLKNDLHTDRFLHPLIRYWQGAFPHSYAHSEDGILFHLPLFTDPLLSPFFVSNDKAAHVAAKKVSHINCIGESFANENLQKLGYVCQRRFYLGVCNPQILIGAQNQRCEILPLKQAMQHEQFWEVLQEGFPKDIGFLRQLLPFLEASSAEQSSVMAFSGERLLGVLNLGVASTVCLAYNAAVRLEYRRQGLSQELIRAGARWAVGRGIREALFWTEHEFLKTFAVKINEYQIFVPSNGDAEKTNSKKLQ